MKDQASNIVVHKCYANSGNYILYSCKLDNNSVRLLAESDENADSKTDTKCNETYSVLFIDPRVGHIMDDFLHLSLSSVCHMEQVRVKWTAHCNMSLL